MRIREASVEDASAIARVAVDTWKTAYRGIIDDNYLNSLSYEEREKGWRQYPFHECYVYVAEDNTQNIIGFAAAGPERESNPMYQGELYAIYINQDYQSKGVGSALFLSILKKLENTGINSLVLWALSASPYRKFYEKHGGKPVQSKLLEMEGFAYQITAYGWPDIKVANVGGIK